MSTLLAAAACYPQRLRLEQLRTGMGSSDLKESVLLQMMSSALVATQVDAGSAAQVPVVLAQLRNATDQGQLQASLTHP